MKFCAENETYNAAATPWPSINLNPLMMPIGELSPSPSPSPVSDALMLLATQASIKFLLLLLWICFL